MNTKLPSTEWVNSITLAEKTNGQIRICLDPTDLNLAIIRKHSPLPSDEGIMTRLCGSVLFSKLDVTGIGRSILPAIQLYLTTCNTLKGRYHFLRLPFGLNSLNEVFQKRMSQVYEGLEGVEVVFDDILVHGATQKQHDQRLRSALQRSKEAKVKLKKCEFGLKEVTYTLDVLSAQTE